jgi:ribosomal protein L11 methyltransferase
MTARQGRPRLEALTIDALPEPAVPAFEAALATVCATTGFFRDETSGLWRVEGVREMGGEEASLIGAFALAVAAAGIDPAPILHRQPVDAEGWVARTLESFPEQPIGRRFLIRPTHLPNPTAYGRIVLRIDAGLAFGTGEHGSTRGCLLALERILRHRPRRVVDLGTGSGILAMAAARALRRQVIATDIDPWSVLVARDNARLNGLGRLITVRQADGWRDPDFRGRRFDLVFGNILARPLCAMAPALAAHLAPGGTAVLAGLLRSQAPMVRVAHRRRGLRLAWRIDVGAWTTLVLRAPGRPSQAG